MKEDHLALNNTMIANLKEAMHHYEAARNLLAHGPADYYFDRLIGAFIHMVERFSPFKVGDTAMLRDGYEVDPIKSPSWLTATHFLKSGELCVIKSVDCDRNGFIYTVSFESESWKGGKAPHAHTFTFRETDLTLIQQQSYVNCLDKHGKEIAKVFYKQ